MKTILLSKTFWVQILALAALVFPPVNAWMRANPVDYLAALAAVNVLLRFFTSGAVTILPASAGPEETSVTTECDDTGNRRLPAWLLLVGLGGVVGISSPACSPVAGTPPVPLRVTYSQDGIVAGYSSKAGLSVDVERHSANQTTP